MNEKLEIWKCNECERDEPCRIIASEHRTDGICSIAKWVRDTQFGLVERKPDYQKMADNKQFGKFWGDGTGVCPEYGHLKQVDAMGFFNADNGCHWHCFIPCTEPQELNPITMEPRK